MAKKKQINDWEAIRQDYRTGKFSMRSIAKKHSLSHQAISKRAKREKWEQDLSQKVRSALNSKLVAKKAKKIVATLATGNPDEINKMAEDLSDEETVEYAALSDLAFLNDWHKRFNETLKAVARMKKELVGNNIVVRIDKDGDKTFGPIGLTTQATMLNSIVQAETKVYHDMRKNLNLEDGPQEPEDTELSEADKDDLKKLAVEAAQKVVANG